MIALFMSHSEPVNPAGPSSMSTVKAPVSTGQGPVVLRLTTSFSVPASFPWHSLRHEPMVAQFTPQTFVRSGESWILSETVAVSG